MEEKGLVYTEKKGYIGYIVLNRPEKHNALLWPMYLMLQDAIDELTLDDDVRVIVLKGNGKSFCAGFDLNEPGWRDHIEVRRAYEKYATPVRTKLWNSPKPSIAQIHGHCKGGAHDIAIACDFCIVSEDVSMGVPEIQFGLGAAWFALPYMVHLRKCREYLLTGKSYGAAEAVEMGIANKVVPKEELDQAVIDFAKDLAVIPVGAMQLQKKGINHAVEAMGFATISEFWLDYSCLGALWKDEQVEEFNRQMEKGGVKGAMKWRDEYFESLMKK